MRTLLLTSALLIVISCSEITYPVPQPAGKKNLEAVPKKLQGLFALISQDDPEPSKPDTVLITADGFHNPKNLHDPKDQELLGDSLVIREYKGLYFMNEALHTEEPNWRLIIIKPLKNGDFQGQYMETGKSFQQLCHDVGKIVAIDSTRKSEGIYQINPTPRQLMKLVKKGSYKRILVFRRIK